MINDESAEPSRIFARFAALVAGFVGLFVLAGWSFGLDQLTSLAPTWPKMARLTAISFMLAGAALWLAASGKHALARGAALLVGAFGFIILLRYAAGWNAHIEQLSFSAISDGPGEPPVRMAPGTAAALCMLG